ncbi:hypothetical protein [Rhizobacter sp. P5_C2]
MTNKDEIAKAIASDPASYIRLAIFLTCLATLLSWFLSVGVGVTGQRAGILWTSRNTYSLSRLQLTLWTWLIMSTLMAVVVCRMCKLFFPIEAGGIDGAMNLIIPNELLQVMGISLGSAAITPLILASKSQPTPSSTLQTGVSSTPVSNAQLDAAADRVGAPLQAMGTVMVRDPNSPPLFKDFFQGDEIAKAGLVDMGKVQQAIVTIVLFGSYLAMVLNMFYTGDVSAHPKMPGTTELPALSQTFVNLLGISQLGYLALKATPAAATTSTNAGALSDPTTPVALPSQVLPRPLPPDIRPLQKPAGS